MSDLPDPYVLPADLPGAEDDGAADHLEGATIPPLSLPVDLGGADRPGRGRRGHARPLLLPAHRPARASRCRRAGTRSRAREAARPSRARFATTSPSCEALGASVLGLSAQPLADQIEFAERVELPYPVLSDPGLALAEALRLPTFEVAGMRLYRRLTLVARRGEIVKVLYPVFPPDRNAADVVAWLSAHPV